MALDGTEVVFVYGVSPIGELAASGEQTTTQDIADLYSSVVSLPAPIQEVLSDFAPVMDAGTNGFTFSCGAGWLQRPGAAPIYVAAQTIDVNPSTTVYMSIDSDGLLGFLAAVDISVDTVIAIVVSNGSAITSITDARCWARTTIFQGYANDTLLDFASNGDPVGLNYAYRAGEILLSTGAVIIDAGTIALTDNADNYISIDDSGTVVNHTTFQPQNWQMQFFAVAGGVVTDDGDLRAFCAVPPNGASGSFTSADAKTVTVVNGLITTIV